MEPLPMITIKQQIEEQLPKDVVESTQELAIELFRQLHSGLSRRLLNTQSDELQYMYALLLLMKYLIAHAIEHYIMSNGIDPLDTNQTKRISESFLIECNNAIHNGVTVTQVPFMDFDNPPIYK